MTLLSIGNDVKTVKGEKIGYLTGVMYLAPSDTSGIANTCPYASEGCKAACLFTAGRGAFNNVQEARINRTKAFKANPQAFLAELETEIAALVRKAAKQGLTPTVRLNGTSDLPWENIRFADGRNIFERFPSIQFYDYTKMYARMLHFLSGHMPKNYHLTFSRSETNDKHAIESLRLNGNVAVVFNTKKGTPLPKTWNGFKVVDGDLTDVRFIDKGKPAGSYNPANGIASLKTSGVVIGLRAKGKAKKDSTGFVVLQ